MSYWWKNKDVCMDGWMVSIQIMLFQSRLWLLGLWLLRRWLLVRRCFRGTWLLRTWFVGTWLLWTWLLRSYLESGYTEPVFNIGDKLTLRIFFTCFTGFTANFKLTSYDISWRNDYNNFQLNSYEVSEMTLPWKSHQVFFNTLSTCYKNPFSKIINRFKVIDGYI